MSSQTWKVVVTSLLTATIASCTPASTPTTSSRMAPDFTLSALDGTMVSLSDYRGKVVLIDFWATFCDPCLQEMPKIVKLYEDKKAQGLEVLAVSIDGPETIASVSAAVSDQNMTFPVLLDEESDALPRYTPKGRLPFTAVIGRQGALVFKRAGYVAGDEASWRDLVGAVDEALAAPP